MSEIDISKYFKLFDDGCYYYIAEMNDELYEDIVDHNKQLQQLKAENEELKKKHIIKNGHCEFFEGQTGLCRAKEFKRCNPINCKVFTLDSVSTILSLQTENQQLKVENEKLKKQYNCYACGNCNGKEDYINLEKHHIGLRKQYDKYSQCLDEIEELQKELCRRCDLTFCGNTVCYEILRKIKQAKEGENG